MLCHGCGVFQPKAESRFVGTDQTAGLYVEEEWRRRNKGDKSTGDYHICTGFFGDEKITAKSQMTSWILRGANMNEQEQVRELTAEERAILRRQP